MKKILTTIFAGAMAAGVAFAEFSVTGNVRVESDVFTYTSPAGSEHSQKWGKGDVNWAKDTKHGDDITIQASGDNVGAKIVFAVTSNIDNAANGAVGLTSYQGWVNDLFGLRLDAGAYDQRLGKNLNNDGDWQENLSATRKTGLGVSLDGADWGKDASNITAIQGNKRTTNFQVSKAGLLDGKLTVRGVLFLGKSGTDANGDSSNNDRWIFTPFALGATYAPDKNTQFALTAKLNSITKGGWKSKAVKYYAETSDADAKWNASGLYQVGSTYKKYDDLTDSEKFDIFGTTTPEITASDGSALTDSGDKYYKATTVYSRYYVPDNSVYTVNFDFYKKLGSGIELQAAYTLGMSLYSNWSEAGAYKDGHLVRDYDVFAHGVDFRVTGIRPVDALSLTAIANVTYVQGRAVDKAKNRSTPVGTTYKDSLAKSYATGAAGQLAYSAAVSLDYQQSDTITFQVQAKLMDENLFSVAKGDSNVTHVDYLNGMSLIVRPAVIVNVGGTSRFFAGVRLSFDGFQQYATGDNNTFKVSAAVPVGLRIKL